VFRLPYLHRFLLLGLTVLTLIAASTVVGEAAAANQKSCAQQVIDDWFDDGRVNKIYPLPCYTQAIKMLPPDLLIYGNAEEEIGRALAFAKQGKPDPGGADPTPTPTDTTTQTTATDTIGTAATDTDTIGTAATDTDTTGTAATDTNTSATDTSGPSSVPIPLLVLGGLAVLLLAAGSAGYLRRRMNGDGDGPGTPPASA
jgi:cobalamin biosynthesis Mg chelatase CobN